MKSLYKLSLVCFLFPLIAFATNDKMNGKYTKEKKVNKEFTVNSGAELNIDNKFGNVTIATWDENRIVIEVIIKTNGDNEAKVNERLNDISVDITGNASRVSARTNIDKKDNSWGWKSKKNVSMEINYIVKMPKSNKLDLTNSYGAITLGDLDGTTEISAKYGQVSLGKLNAIYNDITLKYIKDSTIKHIQYGTLNLGYSAVTIDTAGDLKLNADYTTTRLGVIGSLKYKNRYGKLFIDSVKDIKGNAAYNGAMIGSISGQAIFDAKYSGINVDEIKSTAKNISIDGKYSRITLGVSPEYQFALDANVNYGVFKGTDLFTLQQQENKGRSKHYEGYHGSATSGNLVSINSSYGTVTFKRI